jgi:RNA polymerase sigma-70 factor (ECF subfamily)
VERLHRASPTAQKTDAELLASGERKDFEAFYQRHVQALTAYVGSRVSTPDLTFDLVAETFARALENRTRYDGERGPGIAWLLGIARHLIADAARRGVVDTESRRRLGMARIEIDDEGLARVEEWRTQDLRIALLSLPVAEREAVTRHVMAEEPYPLIAASIGCSEEVARKRVSRGLARLRAFLQDQR